MGIISNTSSEGVTPKLTKLITAIIAVSILFTCFGSMGAFAAEAETAETVAAAETAVSAQTAAETETAVEEVKEEVKKTETPAVTLAAPVMVAEAQYDSAATHPYNKQTTQLTVRYKAVKNAAKYQLYIKGGKYKSWTLYKTTTALKVNVTGLKRATTYSFKVRAVKGSVKSAFSKTQKLSTALMDYDAYGFQAICRIVYHEVGMMSGSEWDKPIVYVSDCVVNRFVAAKYTKIPVWASYYKRYATVQEMIYYSGNFMSSAGLTRDGAVYSKVPKRVKLAVYGALYNKAALNSIKNDSTVYYWCNRAYKSSDKRIAYSFKIPWGYFNVWREYWG